eukprot:4513166-Ditylum_brightwellii.AAC.1
MAQSTVYLHDARAPPNVNITIGDAVIAVASTTAAGKQIALPAASFSMAVQRLETPVHKISVADESGNETL